MGAEEHPDVDLESAGKGAEFNNVDLEVYKDEYDGSGDSGDDKERMNAIADTEEYASNRVELSDNNDSGDEIVYGDLSEDTMQTIPLSEFGGPIPDSATSHVLRIRVNPSEVECLGKPAMNAMTEAGNTVPHTAGAGMFLGPKR